MTKLSRIPLEPKDFGYYINNLWSAFTLLETKEDVKFLFKDLFSHTEYKMFAKRLEIARRLLEGQTYDYIKEELKVTPTTIAHVNNILAEKGQGFRKVHEELKSLEKRYQSKREEYQNYLERRIRKKLPGETFFSDLSKEALVTMNKAVTRRRKRSTASHMLSQ